MYAKSRHQNLQSQNFSKRRKNRNIITSLLVTLSVFTWGFSFVRFTSLGVFSLDEVKVSGLSGDLLSSMQASALMSLEGKYMGILPKSSKFFYPKNEIVNNIEKISPEVDTVNVVKAGGNVLDIEIKTKTPVAIICSGYPDFSEIVDISDIEADCYYIDANAYIFKKAPLLSGSLYHRYYIPSLFDNSSSTENVIGKYASSTQEFFALQKFYNDVEKSGIVADAILVKGTGEYELYVENQASTSDSNNIAVIYFDNNRPLEDELANLVSFWTNMTNKLKNRSATTTFDYIDVRYGANVFYK